MIKPLSRIVVENYSDGTQISKLPDSGTIMNKVNEIVQLVNKQQKQISSLEAKIDHQELTVRLKGRGIR